MSEWQYLTQLVSGSSNAAEPWTNVRVPCPVGMELQVLSLRFTITADATVAARQAIITLAEDDASFASFQSLGNFSLAASQTAVVAASVGMNPETVTFGAIVYAKTQLQEFIAVEKGLLVSVNVLNGQAGDLVTQREIRYRLRRTLRNYT